MCSLSTLPSRSKFHHYKEQTNPLSHRSRYLFSSRINGSINDADATLSLAMCCIMYLCQGHHDPEILDEEISNNILSGVYRLHDFSMIVWLELVERYACFSGSRTLPNELISLLEMLMHKRGNDQFDIVAKDCTQPKLELFKSNWPNLHSMLCKVSQFRRTCSNAEYNKRQGTLNPRMFLVSFRHI